MDEYWRVVGPTIPEDHTDQYTSWRLAKETWRKGVDLKVLDLGCGDGRGVDFFRSIDPQVDYTGVDIDHSPEVDSRRRHDARFDTFDGVNLPYPDASFDMVFSHQVFEHVANPLSLLRSIARVLRPYGHFVGSASQLEPYHSFSYWNYTLYGWCKLLEAAGMGVLEYRPGIDGLTLMHRSLDGRKERYAKYFASESPFNKRIERQMRRQKASVKQIVHRKVAYSGHLIFKAAKRDGEPA